MIGRVKVPMTGGVNLFADPTKIRDDQLAYAKNLVPLKPGVIGRRPAMQWAQNVMFGYNLPGPVIPVRSMFSELAADFVFVCWLEGIMYLMARDSSVITTVSQSLGPSDVPMRASMVQWDGDTYAFTGQTSGARLAFANNAEGYVMEALDFGAGNSGFRPLGAAVIRDRFVYWGFDDGVGGRAVLFADRGLPLQIGDSAVASGRFIPVAGIAQSPITHCAEINTQASGSPNQSVVAVWTTDSMWMLLGEPGETGDGSTPDAIQGTLQQNLLPMSAGCVSGATVAQTPYGTIWAGPDDIWFMPMGSLPIRIGTNIRPALLGNSASIKWKWHATYDAKKAQYRLAIFGPETGPDEFSGCNHHWILDLSGGAPSNADEARWWGPQVYEQANGTPAYSGTYTFLVDNGDDGDRDVYSLVWGEEEVNLGEFIKAIALVTLDGTNTNDTCLPMLERIPHVNLQEYFPGDVIVPYDEDAGTFKPYVWVVESVDGLGPNGGGVTGLDLVPQFNDGVALNWPDGGVEWRVQDTNAFSLTPTASFIPRSWYPENVGNILCKLVTKEYDTGDPMVDKLLDGAELGYWISRVGRVTYGYQTDIDSNTRTLPITGDYLGAVGFPDPNPLALPQTQAFRGQRIWGTRLLTSTPGSRSIGKTVQFWLETDPEYVINETNDTIVIGTNNDVAAILAVPHGVHTYSALKTAVINTLIAGGLLDFQFISTDLAMGSLEGISNGGSLGNNYKIYFEQVGPGATNTPQHFLQRCARLFSIFGFDTNASSFGGTGVEFIRIDETGGGTMAKTSIRQTNSYDLQISGLTLRARLFGRRPQ